MDPSLMLFGASYHWDEPKEADNVAEYNNFNPGLGLKLDWQQEGVKFNVAAGAYKNSINKVSKFFGPGLEIGDSIGLQINGVYLDGYNVNHLPISVMVGGFIRYERVSFHTIFMGDGLGMYVEVKL